jgi:molybdenum cofactor synthesis domain-containing protein
VERRTIPKSLNVEQRTSEPQRAALITISTSKARGEGTDESGARLVELAERLGLALAGHDLIPDDQARIEARLRHWCDQEMCALVLTSGGTGLSPSDRTPEATRAVIEREVPGLAEAMRAASREHSAHWMLSRGVAGVRGKTLILNFPGSPRSIPQIAGAIEPSLPHALALIAGRDAGH